MRVRAVLLLIALLVLAGCSSGPRNTADEPASGAPAPVADSGEFDVDVEMSDDAFHEEGLALGGTDGAQREGAGAGGTADLAAQPGDQPVPPLPESPPAAQGDRVIKEGTVRLELEEGQFDTAFAAVIDAAVRVGGSVVSSSTRSDDNGGTSGSVTVRVPVQAYEDMLVSVGRIGRVRSRQITAQDVTTEFIDLESRLRHLQAQERFYLELLNQAQVVGDAIAVQQQLDGIQGQIEQVRGRVQYLDQRTTFSTLTVELFEPGADLPETRVAEDDRPTLGAYWDSARDAFVNVIGSLLVAGLFLAPLLPFVALAFIAWRMLRRSAATTPPPAAD